MRDLIFSGLEKAINSYLRLDKETIQRLAAYENKVIYLELTDVNMRFYVIVNNNGVQLKNQFAGEINTSIKGSLVDLLRVNLVAASNNAAVLNKLEITGDVELGHEISKLLREVDVDWEEQLSRYLGDVAAHQLGNVTRAIINWSKKTSNSLQQDLTEYLQQEIKLLPPREEMEDFFADINQLRNDLERLQAKLEIWEQSFRGKHR